MNLLEEKQVNCPYCGEMLEVLIEREDAGQQYIEDCQVCCRPIVFNVSLDEAGNVSVNVHDENDAF